MSFERGLPDAFLKADYNTRVLISAYVVVVACETLARQSARATAIAPPLDAPYDPRGGKRSKR